MKLTLLPVRVGPAGMHGKDAEMREKTIEETHDVELIAKAMRMIRTDRRLKTSDVAKVMGLPVRSYEHLESGKGRISYERVNLFAEATSSDPDALWSVLQLRSPEFALRCADNKLMSIMVSCLRELNEELGDDLLFLEPGTAIGAMSKVCKEMVAKVRERDTYAEKWLELQKGKSRKSAPLSAGLRKGRLAET